MYRISDWIGCMSPANVKYVMEHNKEITPSKVEICPNSYEVPKLKSELSKDQKMLFVQSMDYHWRSQFLFMAEI